MKGGKEKSEKRTGVGVVLPALLLQVAEGQLEGAARAAGAVEAQPQLRGGPGRGKRGLGAGKHMVEGCGELNQAAVRALPSSAHGASTNQ